MTEKTSPIADSSVRAITDDGAFRVIVARTTDTAREIARLQKAHGEDARNLGDLVTATVLFRETMAPDLRVQGIVRGADGKGTLVADSAPEGRTRGLLQAHHGAPVIVAGDAKLQMIRSLPNGAINQGVVEVGEGGGITRGVMTYMKESEQVDTMLAVGTVLDEAGNVVAAGGYLVQLLPEVGRAPLAVMAERLEDFRTIEHLLRPDFTPEWLRDELLWGMPFTELDKSGISSACWCSEERLLAALATLDRNEIQDMIEDGAPLEIACDYCTKQYNIQPNKLLGLLASS
ncbi:MAG TPA: Hsp33 family molecular chaperone HslO [Polyangiaceae bacterium]|nr:Hsp33 family molecular chaperone HslO [Polyangiaceae bacterium]